MRKSQKMLLLTLGTGPISDDGKAGYRSVQYTIEGEEYKRNKEDINGTKTNFVAEPIIGKFEPDVIFILGTVKSVWHQFYASVITKDNEDQSYLEDDSYLRLIEIEKKNNIHTSGIELRKLSGEITNIFSSVSKWEKYSSKYKNSQPSVHILLTRYGINSGELKDNYDILKSVEGYLDIDYEYEVAFDITHSFRALPIYNLVIFNYIKNITKYHITIKHIYYGNIEARRELDGKAPIVDLYDLVHILELTNGVAEFKDTGNSVSLVKLIDEKDSFRKVLARFDYAMQLNAFDMIKEELKKLYELIHEVSSDSRYTGVREMIEAVLDEKFFESVNDDRIIVNQISDGDLKFLLAKWFFKQNRKGLGLATGLEALRDITTPAFMKAHGFPLENEKKYRENSEAYFIKIAQELEKKTVESHSAIEECVCNLGINLRRYKQIRNIFAHSLGSVTHNNIEGVINDVKQFENELFALKNEYDNNQSEFENLFNINHYSSKKISASKACRVILDFDSSCNYDEYKKSKTGKMYDVFYLEPMICDRFVKGIYSNKYNITEKAYFLYEYLKKHIHKEYDKVIIVLYKCPDVEKETVFRIFMENLICNGIGTDLEHVKNGLIQPYKKMGISIMLENLEKQFYESKANYMTAMNIPLKQA